MHVKEIKINVSLVSEPQELSKDFNKHFAIVFVPRQFLVLLLHTLIISYAKLVEILSSWTQQIH